MSEPPPDSLRSPNPCRRCSSRPGLHQRGGAAEPTWDGLARIGESPAGGVPTNTAAPVEGVPQSSPPAAPLGVLKAATSHCSTQPLLLREDRRLPQKSVLAHLTHRFVPITAAPVEGVPQAAPPAAPVMGGPKAVTSPSSPSRSCDGRTVGCSRSQSVRRVRGASPRGPGRATPIRPRIPLLGGPESVLLWTQPRPPEAPAPRGGYTRTTTRSSAGRRRLSCRGSLGNPK